VNRTSFNAGWRVRPKVSHFLELLGGGGQPWEEVTLPHDAMIGGRRDADAHWGNGFFPGGVWEYEKTFVAEEALRGKRVLLEFEGVYRGASVWVNGALAGHRPYGYTDFTVSIGEHLRYGEENAISVHATSHDDSRWYSGAGIYRPVHLVVGEPVHLSLDAVQVTTPSVDDGGAVVAVATTLENETLVTTSTTVTTEVLDDTGTVVARDVAPLTMFPGARETLRQRLFVGEPRRWSVEAPHLYSCRTTVEVDGSVIDEETTSFGIRTIDVDAARGLRINGEPVELRGACIHHDNGVIGAATIPRADERRVEILKSAGFNALRSAHHPMSREMLAACDRLGMLVMDEAFDMWTEQKNDDDYGRVFPDWWQADVDAMVRKDVNHPSVIMYSIGNEIPDVGNPAGARIGRAICERIRALDDTRLVTNSINPLLACGPAMFASLGESAGAPSTSPDMGVNTMMSMMEQWLPVLLQGEIVDEKTAEAFASLDVAGYNYTESRYGMDHELHPQRVIVGSETNPAKIARNWELVREHAHVIGDFTWTGWDYLGESGIGRMQYGDGDGGDGGTGGLMGSYPWITSNTGDIDITGFRRPVSHWREIVWGLRTDPYVAVRPPAHHGQPSSLRQAWCFTDGIASWSWPGFEDRPITVEVYADADEVEVLVDGDSVGRAAVGASHPFVASIDTTYAPGELTAVAYRGGAEVGRASLTSASGPVQLDVAVDRARIDATDRDLAYVDVTLVDGNGNLHTSEDRAVTVAVDGPAVLQGFGSGNPCTEETFGTGTHDTFNGRALAVVRPTGAGTIAVTVSAKDCDDRTLTIHAAEPVEAVAAHP
jgi:beta-galactosidase